MQNKTKKNLAQVINTQKTHSKESKTEKLQQEEEEEEIYCA